MLGEVVVEVPAVHQVQDEAEFVGSLEGVVEIDDKRTVDLGQHVLLVEGQRFSLLQFDSLLVQQLHGKPI